MEATVTFWDIAWALLLMSLLSGLLVLGAVAVGGLLVFRTKKESHETVFGKRTAAGGAVNIDETDYRSHNDAQDEAVDDPVYDTFRRMEADNLRFIKTLREQAEEEERSGEAPSGTS